MRKITFLFAFIMAFSMMNAQNPGDFDATFGDNGIVNTIIGDAMTDELEDVTIQPDGKILACGYSKSGSIKRMALVRYNTDGSIDTSFGNNGIVIITRPNGNSFIRQTEVLSDGKIILCGYGYTSYGKPNPVMIRLNSDGSMDSSFGDNGIVTFPSLETESSVPYKMAMQADGKVLYVGDRNDDVMVMRINEDGSIDESFGINGFYTADINGLPSWSYDITVQEDGKIALVVGHYIIVDEQSMMKCSVTRLNSDGTSDTGFGDNGTTYLPLGEGPDFAIAIKVQRDGKIVVGGHSWDSNGGTAEFMDPTYSLAVVRLNEDGSYDDTFANSGMFRERYLPTGENYLTDIAVSEDGNIYGSYDIRQIGNVYSMGLFCLASDGKLNPDFGENGYTQPVLLSQEERPKAIALQDDGKIVLSGYSYNFDEGLKFTLVRYHGLESSSIECTPPSDLLGEYVAGMVELQWSSAREYRTLSHYNVYRKTDNTGNYELIAETEETEYSDDLSEVPGEAIYYQVTAVYEENGDTCESEPANSATNPEQDYVLIDLTSVAENVNTTVAVYPNPIQDVLNIAYEGDFNIQIIDVTGRVVFTAENSRSLNLSSLESGNYIIKLVSDSETLFNRFMKL